MAGNPAASVRTRQPRWKPSARYTPLVLRRLLFAVIPLVAGLGAAEVVGRRHASASAPAHLYEPNAVLVEEIPVSEVPNSEMDTGDAGASHRRTARPELHPQTWSMPAPGFRVAFVGDSTVWGQLPEAFGQGLQVPGRAVEVLNFGIRGAASDRARMAARAAVDQDLDLLVVYVGHNEGIEARLNPASLEPFWKRRIRASLLRSGAIRLLAGALGAGGDGPLPAPDDRALRGQGDGALLPLTPAEWASIAASYRTNLSAICAIGADAGAPVVLVEPISSLVNPGEAPAGSTDDLRPALMSGYEAARLGNPASALLWADRLRGYYPDFGPPRALRGAALLGLGRRDEALDELRAARVHDAQPSRVTEAGWAILREAAADCAAPSIATEPAFLADPRYLSLADPLFMDRVHLTLDGNVRLAGTIAEALIAAPQTPETLPSGATWDPRRVTLTAPETEALRGWKVLDELWR